MFPDDCTSFHRRLKLAAASFVLFLIEATLKSHAIPNKNLNLGILLKIWKIRQHCLHPVKAVNPLELRRMSL